MMVYKDMKAERACWRGSQRVLQSLGRVSLGLISMYKGCRSPHRAWGEEDFTP